MNTKDENTEKQPEITEEQIKQIQQAIESSFNDVNINNPEELIKFLQDNYVGAAPAVDDPVKLLSCAHEIIFSITANVMEENEHGETTRCVEVCNKNYHIPVPPLKDYNVYMDTFFKFLENCIASAANHTKDIKDKDHE
jgi:hypothetical protein